MQYWSFSSERGWIVQDLSAWTAICPACRGVAGRVPRRFIDRLVSRFIPRYRYRCQSLDCAWEGNLSAVRE